MNSNFIGYCENNDLHSDAWGETLWMKSGKVVASEKKYDINIEPSFIEKLKANNKSIQ